MEVVASPFVVVERVCIVAVAADIVVVVVAAAAAGAAGVGKENIAVVAVDIETVGSEVASGSVVSVGIVDGAARRCLVDAVGTATAQVDIWQGTVDAVAAHCPFRDDEH